MGLVKEILGEYMDYFKATFARCMFLMHALIVIWRTVVLLGSKYWFISIGILCIIAEYFVTLIVRNGQEWNWISPATLCYLISALPGLWLQKLYHLGHYGQISNSSVATVPSTSLTLDFSAEDWMLLSEQTMMVTIILSRWLLPKGSMTHNEVSQLLLLYLSLSSDIIDFLSIFSFDKVAKDEAYCYVLLFWFSLAMLQFTLVLTSTQENDNNNNSNNNNTTTNSKTKTSTTNNDNTNNTTKKSNNTNNFNKDKMTKFNEGITTTTTTSPKHLHNNSASSEKVEEDLARDVERGKEEKEEEEKREEDGEEEEMRSLKLREVLCSSELWAILVVFFLQDGPFLANRLVVMMHFKVFNYTIIFFICKNILVLALQTYRVIILCQESRAKVTESKAKVKAALKARRYSKISLYSFETISTIEEMKNDDEGDDDDDEGGDNNNNGDDSDDNFEARDVALTGTGKRGGVSLERRLPAVPGAPEQDGLPASSAYRLPPFSPAFRDKLPEGRNKLPPIVSVLKTREERERPPQPQPHPRPPASLSRTRSQSETDDHHQQQQQQQREESPTGFTSTSKDKVPENSARFPGALPPQLSFSREGRSTHTRPPFNAKRKPLRNLSSTGDLYTNKEPPFFKSGEKQPQDASKETTAASIHTSSSAWLSSSSSSSPETSHRTPQQKQQQQRKLVLELFLKKSRHELVSGQGVASVDVLPRGLGASTAPLQGHLGQVSDEGSKDRPLKTSESESKSAGIVSRTAPFPLMFRHSDSALPL